MLLPPDLKPVGILIYLRKSRTDDPALSVTETLAKHEQMLDEWCGRNLGGRVPEENRFREVVSGETVAARPELRKLLHLIEQPQYQAVLTVDPQRLSRGDLEDIGRLTKLFRYTGTRIITLQGIFDLEDARDRDYFSRELMRGNDYLEYQKRIMANGRALSAENGNYLGSCPPFGYVRTKLRIGRRWAHTLEMMPEDAETVRLIFQMYASGSGAAAICARLNASGIRPQKGARWTPPTIYGMLDNPVYIGMVKWQARKTVRTVEDGAVIKHTEHRREYPVYPGRHPAIIDEVLWNAVRERRDARSIPRMNLAGRLKNPLSGLLRCECGCSMIRRPYHGRCADRLQCPNMKTCGNASCTLDEMLMHLERILRRCITDFPVSLQSSSAAEYDAHETYLKKLRARCAALDAKERGLWEKYAEGMPQAVFAELLAVNQAERVQAGELLRQAEAEKVPVCAARDGSFHAALAALHGNVSADLLNAMLKCCISRIEYRRERGTRTGRGWEMRPIRLRIELRL